jgi:hypothetical protein
LAEKDRSPGFPVNILVYPAVFCKLSGCFADSGKPCPPARRGAFGSGFRGRKAAAGGSGGAEGFFSGGLGKGGNGVRGPEKPLRRGPGPVPEGLFKGGENPGIQASGRARPPAAGAGPEKAGTRPGRKNLRLSAPAAALFRGYFPTQTSGSGSGSVIFRPAESSSFPLKLSSSALRKPGSCLCRVSRH